MRWFGEMFKNYANFSGRATCPAYWWPFLLTNILFLGLGFIDLLAGTALGHTGLGLFSGLFAVVVVIPLLAVGVRRLHDTGLSGW